MPKRSLQEPSAGILLYPNVSGTADEALAALYAHKLTQAKDAPSA